MLEIQLREKELSQATVNWKKDTEYNNLYEQKVKLVQKIELLWKYYFKKGYMVGFGDSSYKGVSNNSYEME